MGWCEVILEYFYFCKVVNMILSVISASDMLYSFFMFLLENLSKNILVINFKKPTIV
jgi:hypothetical protein